MCLVVVACLLINLCFFIFYYLHHEQDRKFLTIVLLDVGQGDSIFIEAPNGHQILIDGGPTSSVVREISKFLHGCRVI